MQILHSESKSGVPNKQAKAAKTGGLPTQFQDRTDNAIVATRVMDSFVQY